MRKREKEQVVEEVLGLFLIKRGWGQGSIELRRFGHELSDF